MTFFRRPYAPSQYRLVPLPTHRELERSHLPPRLSPALVRYQALVLGKIMTKPSFPLIWDNTMRGQFVKCGQRFNWEFMRHYKHLRRSVDLHAGAAWAKALEVTRLAFYRDNIDPLHAQALGLEALILAYGNFEPPPKSNKTLDGMIRAWNYYFRAFPLADDPVQPYMGRNGPMVEFNFVLPLLPDGENPLLHPDTGEPILWTGRSDMIATYAGAVSIYDDKTTQSLGAQWAGQWDRRAQFTGYSWAARAYGIPTTQVVVRGISILKEDTNHAQVITVRTKHHIDEWHQQVVRDIRRAIQCYKEEYWDLNLDDGCSSYGGCMFKQPCMSSDPEPWLSGGNYAVRVWNPLTRTEDENA